MQRQRPSSEALTSFCASSRVFSVRFLTRCKLRLPCASRIDISISYRSCRPVAARSNGESSSRAGCNEAAPLCSYVPRHSPRRRLAPRATPACRAHAAQTDNTFDQMYLKWHMRKHEAFADLQGRVQGRLGPVAWPAVGARFSSASEKKGHAQWCFCCMPHAASVNSKLRKRLREATENTDPPITFISDARQQAAPLKSKSLVGATNCTAFILLPHSLHSVRRSRPPDGRPCTCPFAPCLTICLRRAAVHVGRGLCTESRSHTVPGPAAGDYSLLSAPLSGQGRALRCHGDLRTPHLTQ